LDFQIHSQQPVEQPSVEVAQQKVVQNQVVASNSSQTKPVPVVRVLSPVGVEYVFLTITLFVGAIALASALIALVNGKTDFSVLAFPAAVLLITVPTFAGFFLRLKKLEVDLPEMRLDPSKRRSTQFTQIVSFIVILFTLIGFVFDVFMKLGGQGGPSIVKAILDALCVLVVAGGILAYYWRDEHKRKS
jgi:hypothetical protein